eukprot:gnl/MRDRNA2_/MRDRNA2_134978_c0_seq1.p1 gnl/MRDRNA2_/MRDRNA2_134978_c0~~gnl/MRDRNA2_/MRDRNA2_134978_c0_seq1.p1  ORF type:complete len:370 (-),score=70.02 gnl/MRDRNA2_/MRDRNA2_134978_c0_seq1:40-1149(-)
MDIICRLACFMHLAPAFGAHFRVSVSQTLLRVDQEQSSPVRRRRSNVYGQDSSRNVTTNSTTRMQPHPSLGVVRLDYFYDPVPGDIDHPDSYDYDVYFRVVPGMTFEMAKSGKMTPVVQQRFFEAIDWLDKEKGVSGITADCGFMMWFQPLARQRSTKPIFMSSLVQLPAVTGAYAEHEKIAIVTASRSSIMPMRHLIHDETGVDPDDQRYIFVGAEDVPHFGEEVALGKPVDVEKATPGVVDLALQVKAKFPSLRAFLLECTEMPPYSDAIRRATGLPVYDAITAADMFMSGMQDNERFGRNDWQEPWDGEQADYKYGEEVPEDQRDMIVNRRKVFNAMRRGMNLMFQNGTFPQNALPTRSQGLSHST